MRQVFNINQLPAVMTLEEAALYLRHGVGTLKKLCQQQRFPGYKLDGGTKWIVDRDDLFKYQAKIKENKNV